jgi:hypothetical protein
MNNPISKPDDTKADPLAEMLNASDLVPKKFQVEEWLARVEELKFCTARREYDGTFDHDNCDTLSDIDTALELAKKLGLSIFDPLPRGRKAVPLMQHVYHQAIYHECLVGALVEYDKTEDGKTVHCKSIDNCMDAGHYIVWRVRQIGVSQAGTLRRRIDVPVVWLEWKKDRYWDEVAAGKWESMTETATKRKLMQAGLSGCRPAPGVMSEVEDELINIRDNQSVDWAGSLSGYPPGILETNGKRVLLISGPRLIEPVEGDWNIIKSILGRMLDSQEQFQMFNLWLKVGYEALREDRTQPGQMVILTGPRDCLKSFTQHFIITPVVGGREADAARYLTGRTEFNADLAGAEHVFLDDMRPYHGWLARHDLTENLKGFIVGKNSSIHAKGREAENLPCRWRVTMSLNDDDDAIKSLPEITESFEDKVNLFKCQKFSLPLPNFTPDEKRAFEAAVQGALPGYIHYLTRLEIPEHLRSSRFIVSHYHHPELIEKVSSMSKEGRLLELIDLADLPETQHQEIIKSWGRAWVGTAVQLERELMEPRNLRPMVQNLLNFENAAGTLLGRLAKRVPDRCQPWVHKIDGEKVREWIIAIPESTGIRHPEDVN